MPTLLQWTSVGIGDLDVFAPSPPCLVVYTSYAYDEPESSVTYFWQDEATGMLNHELVYVAPVPFETALAWAQEHAPTRNIERIHVRNARAKKAPEPKVAAKRVVKKVAARKAAAKKTPPAARKGAAAKPAAKTQKKQRGKSA